MSLNCLDKLFWSTYAATEERKKRNDMKETLAFILFGLLNAMRLLSIELSVPLIIALVGLGISVSLIVVAVLLLCSAIQPSSVKHVLIGEWLVAGVLILSLLWFAGHSAFVNQGGIMLVAPTHPVTGMGDKASPYPHLLMPVLL
ncbi:MAG: hypothetical protein NVS4B7_08510 [Ktedonobacteraceae bacterium]